MLLYFLTSFDFIMELEQKYIHTYNLIDLSPCQTYIMAFSTNPICCCERIEKGFSFRMMSRAIFFHRWISQKLWRDPGNAIDLFSVPTHSPLSLPISLFSPVKIPPSLFTCLVNKLYDLFLPFQTRINFRDLMTNSHGGKKLITKKSKNSRRD